MGGRSTSVYLGLSRFLDGRVNFACGWRGVAGACELGVVSIVCCKRAKKTCTRIHTWITSHSYWTFVAMYDVSVYISCMIDRETLWIPWCHTPCVRQCSHIPVCSDAHALSRPSHLRYLIAFATPALDLRLHRVVEFVTAWTT